MGFSSGGEGRIGVRHFPQFSAVFRGLFVSGCPPCVFVGALCVPCAAVLLLEAPGGLVTAPQFSAVCPQFPQFLQMDLTLPEPPPM